MKDSKRSFQVLEAIIAKVDSEKEERKFKLKVG